MAKLNLPATLLVLLLSSGAPLLAESNPIPNEAIDAEGFLQTVQTAHLDRRSRRISEAEFLKMATDENTIILDARSANRFAQKHIVGAKNLPFTDFTEDALKTVIPSKDTRILIYCNNNIENSLEAFPLKKPAASLNLSTFPALYSYGYENVYELGPMIDPATSKIQFQGSLVD